MRIYKTPFHFGDEVIPQLIIQNIILVLAAIILHQLPFPIASYTFIGYWVGFAIAASRRSAKPTGSDILYVKLGYFALLFIGPACGIPLVALRVHLIGH